MKIMQSHQQAEMQHRYQAEREVRWVRPGPADTEGNRTPEVAAQSRASITMAQSLQVESSTRVAATEAVDNPAGFGQDLEMRMNMLLLAMTLERITGWPVRMLEQPLLVAPERLQATQVAMQEFSQALLADRSNALQVSSQSAPAVGEEFVREERVSEHEQLQANFSGAVVRADGTQQAFEVELKLERAFEGVAWQRAPLHDPLVIQLDNRALSLNQERFSFDLNSDGVEELLPQLGEGYGFLALDRNEDGQINNGTELFGAQTGNGFGELAQYDQDGNGFIDEGDAIYQKLAVWRDPGDGSDPQLLALAEVGIGAISLQAVATPFRFTDELGQTLGQLRSSAVVLGDNSAGLIHQIDLAL